MNQKYFYNFLIKLGNLHTKTIMANNNHLNYILTLECLFEFEIKQKKYFLYSQTGSYCIIMILK